MEIREQIIQLILGKFLFEVIDFETCWTVQKDLEKSGILATVITPRTRVLTINVSFPEELIISFGPTETLIVEE